MNRGPWAGEVYTSKQTVAADQPTFSVSVADGLDSFPDAEWVRVCNVDLTDHVGVKFQTAGGIITDQLHLENRSTTFGINMDDGANCRDSRDYSLRNVTQVHFDTSTCTDCAAADVQIEAVAAQ